MMARKHIPRPKPTSSNPPSGEVGYGRPPVAFQFKKGVSGNWRGRPKGARNKRPALHGEGLAGIILAEANRTIKVNEGGKQTRLTMLEAVVRALAVNGARGQLRSAQAFMTLLAQTEQARKARYDKNVEEIVSYRIDWENELERRRQTGENGPEPLPHPDDVLVDARTGDIVIKGPKTKEEKAEWDRHWDRVEACDRAIAVCTAELEDPKMREYADIIRDEIAFETRIRKIITDVIGEPRRRKQETHRQNPNERKDADFFHDQIEQEKRRRKNTSDAVGEPSRRKPEAA
jgi:Family of unknown function (DUF5681)